jgi:hypothetical protein
MFSGVCICSQKGSFFPRQLTSAVALHHCTSTIADREYILCDISQTICTAHLNIYIYNFLRNFNIMLLGRPPVVFSYGVSDRVGGLLGMNSFTSSTDPSGKPTHFFSFVPSREAFVWCFI